MSEPPRALLVEDEPAWQEVLAELLEEQGLEVDRAASLDSAARVLGQRSHRVAVVDLSLGGADHANRDGLRVLDLLRRHDPECRAILVSGYATVEIAVRALADLGALSCLRKEAFSRSEFVAFVQRALAAAPAPEASCPEVGSPPRGEALLVDDDAGWRAVLRELLEEAGYSVRAAASYAEGLGLVRRASPALAVVDLSLASSLAERNRDGLRLLHACRQDGIPTVVVSGTADAELVEQVYRDYDPLAFLEKQAFERRSFRELVEGWERAPASGSLEDLTARELEVLDLLAGGHSNAAIAERLVISPNTVKRHLQSVFEKLGVRTRAAATARALQAGRSPRF